PGDTDRTARGDRRGADRRLPRRRRMTTGEHETDAREGDPKVNATNGQQRLDEFAEEVKKLKVSGGLANPERTGTTLGVLLMVVGGFIVVILSFAKRGETEFADSSAGLSEIIQATNNVWTALFGVALILLGLAIWIRY